MMLAAIPGELIGVVIFVVAALLKWLGDRASEQETAMKPPRSAPAQRGGDASAKTSWEVDEERKRRFMEALGLPATDQPPQREAAMELRPTAKAVPQALPRPSAIPPIPPFVYREQNQKRKKAVPIAPPAPPPVLTEPLPAAAIPTKVSSLPEGSGFELHRDISGTEDARPERNSRDNLAILREELGRQDSARRAFLLKEILGPPPGLQMPGSVPSFRSP